MRSGSVPGVSAMQRVPVSNGKRKTVAIVVSADTGTADFDEDEFHEHAVSCNHAVNRNNADNLAVNSFPSPKKHRLQEDPPFRSYICAGARGAST
jgi:mitochondrial fission protein ELM1